MKRRKFLRLRENVVDYFGTGRYDMEVSFLDTGIVLKENNKPEEKIKT